MKIGFQIVLYLLCLNLISGLVYTLQVAGTSYTNPIQGSGNSSDYIDRFDPDRVMNSTQPNILIEVPFLDTVYGALMNFWNGVRFVVMGFPTLLEQFAGAIQDATARTAYLSICYVLDAVCSFIFFGWIFQVVTGRQVQD